MITPDKSLETGRCACWYDTCDKCRLSSIIREAKAYGFQIVKIEDLEKLKNEALPFPTNRQLAEKLLDKMIKGIK